jgi:predicted aspartyl protease
MSKKLTSTKFPFLPLLIHVRVTKRIDIELDTEALIDTGFSGDIVVPVSRELQHFSPDAYATWTMADGSEVLAPIFLARLYP